MADGKIIDKPVENIKMHGITLIVKNKVDNKRLVILNFNYPNNFDFEDFSYNLLLHQEGNYIKIPLEINNSTERLVKALDNEKLYNGVNTITVLANDKPIAERLFFVRRNQVDFKNKLYLSLDTITSNDSLNLKLGFDNLYKMSQVSISVLPSKTQSYVKNQNISSAFLLDPFVNGYIENKSYYFTNPNRKVDYDLDLLLMIQGWSKYSWDNIFNKKVKNVHERKDGIDYLVSFNNRIPKRAKDFIVNNTTNNPLQLIDIKNGKNYKLENTYPYNGEKIKLSISTKDNKSIRPNAVISNSLVVKEDKLNIQCGMCNSINNLRDYMPEFEEEMLYSNFELEEQLDEITLTALSQKLERKIKEYGRFYASDVIEVDKELVNEFRTLEFYLNRMGYQGIEDSQNGFNIKRISYFDTDSSLDNSIFHGESDYPTIFLDGNQLHEGFHVLLKNRFLNEFEEILVDKSGFYGLGLNKSGVIVLKSRRTPLDMGNDDKLPYFVHNVTNGFERPKEFYMPKYVFFHTEEFQQIGTIAWFSDITIQARQSIKLPIFYTGLDEFTIFIEGIAEDGSLINIKKTIDVSDVLN